MSCSDFWASLRRWFRTHLGLTFTLISQGLSYLTVQSWQGGLAPPALSTVTTEWTAGHSVGLALQAEMSELTALPPRALCSRWI